MKVVSRDILHKSDVGGVLLDLDNKEEVLDAYQTIIHNCKAYKSNAVIDGIEIVEQVKPGTEVIIGGRRDKAFGPIIMFGFRWYLCRSNERCIFPGIYRKLS